jgi:hypothetical protein
MRLAIKNKFEIVWNEVVEVSLKIMSGYLLGETVKKPVKI